MAKVVPKVDLNFSKNHQLANSESSQSIKIVNKIHKINKYIVKNLNFIEERPGISLVYLRYNSG
jgi:hypothetical protein